MRYTQIENLWASSANLIPSLEQLELQMQLLNGDSDYDKQLWHFARLLYTDDAFIKNFGGKTFMRSLSFDSIQKKLDKKNAELAKVRALRKKLADREKIISLDIDNLQNQKVEAIFLQVKREIKQENLNISSGSILPLLEALRSSQPSSDYKSFEEKIVIQANVSLVEPTKITDTGRNIDEH